MTAPLFVIPDSTNEPPRRYYVKDRAQNILFITSLEDQNPEETAVKWAIKRRGWLAGILEGGDIISSKNDKTVLLSFGVDKPLYIVLDGYRRRFLVVDDEDNVLFLTDLDEREPEQAATLAAMKLGGWLKGAVKSNT
jgi:hypothetical protein